MADLTGMRLAVAGAGVLGLCVALRAAAAGAAVKVWDPGGLGDNASGVAGGMIAPVGEALFDDPASPFDLLCAGRDLWPALEALADDLHIVRCGARLLFDDEAALQAAIDRLLAVGAAGGADLVDDPGRAGDHRFTLWTPHDWRLDPRPALQALASALIARGGRFRAANLTPDRCADFDAVVLAAGIGSGRWADVAPELARVEPIKGQIVRFSGPAPGGPILRARDLYLVPQPGGMFAGATMEPGLADRIVDPQATARLRAAAIRLAPALADCAFEGMAGVRASTPDGLPLAGPSAEGGLFLATGARRNGWLLAPLVSEILVSYLSGGDGGPFAAALDPRRILRRSEPET